jgi:beta-lactamase regulating signal transducer with metallopeptidase domain
VLNAIESAAVDVPPLSSAAVGYAGGETPDLSIVEPNPNAGPEEQASQYEINRQEWQEETDAARSKTGAPITVSGILKAIWLSGAFIVALWLLITNLRFFVELRRSRHALESDGCPIPVYISAMIDTPCLFGLFRPAIYLTPEVAANKTTLRHSIEHEITHFRHRDHIWSLLRGVCLALHWYNPLVWWAAVLSRNDGELACDEATIKRIGENERAEYGRTLINMTCQKPPVPLLTATTMTGSRGSLRERITLIAKKPKTAVFPMIAVLLIAAVAAGCTFTGAQDGSRPDADQTLYDRAGFTVAIPDKYTDRLYIPDSFSESELIKVYEKQSYEESRADWGEDSCGGFLFGILRYTQAQYEGYLFGDNSGLSFFAKDDTGYYGHSYATDVQFYRSDTDLYTADMFAPWNELSDAVDGILDDFVSRNNLTPYSDSEFWSREFTYDSDHVYRIYYPYYAYQETAAAQGFSWEDVSYKLVLSQPAAQGEAGIWCVERWYDSDGTVHCYFPSCDGRTDLAAADYYAQLQSECDSGHRPKLLDPVQVAMEFAVSYFGHAPVSESFEAAVSSETGISFGSGSGASLQKPVFSSTLAKLPLFSPFSAQEIEKTEELFVKTLEFPEIGESNSNRNLPKVSAFEVVFKDELFNYFNYTLITEARSKPYEQLIDVNGEGRVYIGEKTDIRQEDILKNSVPIEKIIEKIHKLSNSNWMSAFHVEGREFVGIQFVSGKPDIVSDGKVYMLKNGEIVEYEDGPDLENAGLFLFLVHVDRTAFYVLI